MPIWINEEMPVARSLREERIDVAGEGEDALEIAILNLMPNKQETERQLLRPLAGTPLQARVTFLRLETHRYRHVSEDYLRRYYAPFSAVAGRRFDGLIVTGAPVETLPFAQVDYCCFLYASTKIVEEQPELIAAILRAYHKAQQWIAENPAEAAELIDQAGYVSVEDHDLAAALLDAYAFPNHAHHVNVVDIKADVEYFAQALYDVGYLSDDPAAFTEKAYAEIDLTLGQE